MYGYVKEYPHASIPVHLFDGDFCYDLMRSEALIHRRLIGLMPFLDLIIQAQPNISESIYLLYTINLFNTAITYFFSYRTSLLIASQRNYIVGGINYLITIIQSFLQMVYLLAFRDYLGYLLIQTVGTFLYNIIVSRIAVRYFPCIRRPNVKPLPKEEKRSLFANIRDLMIYKVSGLLVNSTDNILITFFGGLATTGIASNYTLLVNTLNSLLSQLFNGLTASIGNHNASESVEKRYEMFRFLNMMNFWLFGWASLGIFFCSGDLVELCFGAEYVLPLHIPLVMAVNFYTVGMMNAVWTYKHTLGLFRHGRFLQILTGILNIVFSVWLGTCWGLFGILLATVLSRLFTSLWFDPYAVYTHGFGISPLAYLKRYVQYLLILLAAAALCHLSMSIISGSVVFRTIARIVMCSVVTNAVFVFWFHRTPEFRKLVDILLRLRNKVLRK